MRVTPAQLDELLHRILDPKAEKGAKVLAKGLPAGPGGATGKLVFTAADAVAAAERGESGHPGPQGDQPRGRGRHAGGRRAS